MTTLLVRFTDRNVRDETVECDDWDSYVYSDYSDVEWFRCKAASEVVFQAQARQVLFFRVQK